MRFLNNVSIKGKIMRTFITVMFLTACVGVTGMVSLHNAGGSVWLTGGILLGALLLTPVLAAALSDSIVKPVGDLADAARELAKGSLNVKTPNANQDELGELSRSIAEAAGTLSALVDEVNALTAQLEKDGNVDARLNVSRFAGCYGSIAAGVNAAISGLADGINGFSEVTAAFADGSFDVAVKQLAGKKPALTNPLNRLKDNLNRFSGDITKLIRSASAGELSARIDSGKYSRNWAEMAEGLNNVMDGADGPVRETIQVLRAMSEGRLDEKITGAYKGEYAAMKNSVNETLDVLSSYIRGISGVLDQMSLKNFNVEITNDYTGDFAPIKQSLNRILDTFNEVLGEINTSAEQVASGAKVISDSSMNLAQGSNNQSGAIERLMNTVDSITDQTKQNADNAGVANESLDAAKNRAVEGNIKMQTMLKAMDQINESSENISRAISMIDSISLQTNMLSLNAAVEAAKAGQYGKGFTVVAEEVRMLANRSKNAAKEIADLINLSVENVADGKRIADETAVTLQQIVEQITGVSDLVGEVAKASLQQEEGLQVINESIGQISEVAQTNTATSEEEAASAQQLYSQSEIFKSMVSKFNLKDHRASSEASAPRETRRPESPRPQPKQAVAAETARRAPKQAVAHGHAAAEPKPAATLKPAAAANTAAAPKQTVAAKPVSQPKPAAPKQAVAAASRIPAAKPESPRGLTGTEPDANGPKPAARSFTQNYGTASYDSRDFGKYS